MGGQACVLYGTAQFSKDIDLLILADPENFVRLQNALNEIKASRIAVPPFQTELLERGHAVHFRCQVPQASGLRIDVMTRLRDLPPFQELWSRRTTLKNDEGGELHLLSVADLVQAKKTQRSKDWPMIEALVEEHYIRNQQEANPDFIRFWLEESRIPERLFDLVREFPDQAREIEARRPLLSQARLGNLSGLREAIDAEVRNEQEKDRTYWEPLKREMAEFRRLERQERTR